MSKIIDCVHIRDLPNGNVSLISPAFVIERTGFSLADAARDIRSAIKAAFAAGIRPLRNMDRTELHRLGLRNLMTLEIEVD